MKIKGYTLDGGGMCPEQYDVLLDGKQVGYLRLRHGQFTARCPDALDTLVYSANPIGDGCFEPEERDEYLTKAVEAIDSYLKEKAL